MIIKCLFDKYVITKLSNSPFRYLLLPYLHHVCRLDYSVSVKILPRSVSAEIPIGIIVSHIFYHVILLASQGFSLTARYNIRYSWIYGKVLAQHTPCGYILSEHALMEWILKHVFAEVLFHIFKKPDFRGLVFAVRKLPDDGRRVTVQFGSLQHRQLQIGICRHVGAHCARFFRPCSSLPRIAAHTHTPYTQKVGYADAGISGSVVVV